MAKCVVCGKELPKIGSTGKCSDCCRKAVQEMFKQYPDVEKAFHESIEEMKKPEILRAKRYRLFEIIPKKLILYVYTKKPIKYFFGCKDGIMLRNLRFNFKWCKHNPKGRRLHIQIWQPFLYLVRDNSKLEIGNKYRLMIYH